MSRFASPQSFYFNISYYVQQHDKYKITDYCCEKPIVNFIPRTNPVPAIDAVLQKKDEIENCVGFASTTRHIERPYIQDGLIVSVTAYDFNAKADYQNWNRLFEQVNQRGGLAAFTLSDGFIERFGNCCVYTTYCSNAWDIGYAAANEDPPPDFSGKIVLFTIDACSSWDVRFKMQVYDPWITEVKEPQIKAR